MLELLGEIAAHGQDEVLFTGGEPLLVEHLFDYLERGVAAGLSMRVFTNGTLLDRPRVARLMEIGAKGALGLILSLDAVDPALNDLTKGTGDRALVALDLLHEMGACRALAVTLNTVLTAKNLDQVEPLLERGSRRGVREHRFDFAILHPADAYRSARELDLTTLPPARLRDGLDRLCAALDRPRPVCTPPADYYASLRDGRLRGEPNFRATCKIVWITGSRTSGIK